MKSFIILILLISKLFSSTQDKIISDVLFSFDSKEYIQAKDFNLNEHKSFYIKFILDKNEIKNKRYYLRLNHNYGNIKDLNVKAKRKDNKLIIIIDKNTNNEILINVDATKNKNSLYLDVDIYDENEFERTMDSEKYLFGLAYGIIFCAFLYNLVLFLFNKERSFLYYSLLQLSLLFILLNNTMTLNIFKPMYEYLSVGEFFGHIALVFAILFNRAFLDSKTYIPKLDKILLFSCILLSIDLASIILGNESFIYEYLPNSLLLALLLFSSILVYKQGYKIAIFYILGWSVLFLSVFFVEFDFLDYSDAYSLHLGLPLESLILSFSLGYKMKELEKSKILHEQMMIHQNKLASMGEMINNIAHQYRQPLTHLGYILMNINSAFEHDELDKKYLDKKMKQVNNQLEFMSKTVDNFRDFYKPKTQKEEFYIKDSINKAISIIKPILEENEIDLEIKLNDKKILGFDNEYSQIILNLLTNAKDALIEKEILNPKIEILMENNKVYIKDNAKGIPKDLEEKIFEPYFTTKDKGSGIGLYMSLIIIQEHFNGNLVLENSKEGASFIINT